MEPSVITVLVHRAAAGDQAAWNAIVDEYAGLVWSVVRGFRLGEAQAADAVQSTWLRLIEHLSDIREPERLAGWLRTTARRVCLEALRGAARELPVAEHHDDACTTSGYGAGTGDDRPDVRLLRREQETLVRQALAALPERHQVLMALLVASPAVSYQEISDRLGMPIGSIGPTRGRILARLREALEEAGVHDWALS